VRARVRVWALIDAGDLENCSVHNFQKIARQEYSASTQQKLANYHSEPEINMFQKLPLSVEWFTSSQFKRTIGEIWPRFSRKPFRKIKDESSK
jgi:hypothetical protein